MIPLTNKEIKSYLIKFVIYVKKNLVPMMAMKNTRYKITVIAVVNIGTLLIIFLI